MTNIFIIRHGEVGYQYDSNGRKLMYRPEVHLSDEGKVQLVSFANSLKDRGVKLDRIETSPFTRALESSRVLSQVFDDVEIVENPAFADSHVPGWFDLPISMQEELMSHGEDIYLNPRSSDQEAYEHIAQRMLDGFNEVAKRNDGQTVAIVSHGDPIRLLLYRLGRPEGKIPNMSFLSKEGYLKRGEAYRVRIDNEGRVLETELIASREGVPGQKEFE